MGRISQDSLVLRKNHRVIWEKQKVRCFFIQWNFYWYIFLFENENIILYQCTDCWRSCYDKNDKETNVILFLRIWYPIPEASTNVVLLRYKSSNWRTGYFSSQLRMVCPSFDIGVCVAQTLDFNPIRASLEQWISEWMVSLTRHDAASS